MTTHSKNLNRLSSTASQLKLNPETVQNLSSELIQIAQNYAEVASLRNVNFKVDIENKPYVAYWDIECLRQHVFSHLLQQLLASATAGESIFMRVYLADIYTLKIDIEYSAAIKLSNNTSTSDDQPTANSTLDLSYTRQCIEAHLGELTTYAHIDSGSAIKIKLPLYKLCMQ